MFAALPHYPTPAEFTGFSATDKIMNLKTLYSALCSRILFNRRSHMFVYRYNLHKPLAWTLLSYVYSKAAWSVCGTYSPKRACWSSSLPQG